MDPSDIILRFLESVGRRSEAELYLSLFRAERKESFALLLVESTVLRHATDAIVLDLRFLAGLGLFPVVVLGLFHPSLGAQDAAERLRRRLEQTDVAATALSFGDATLAETVTTATRAGRIPIVTFSAPAPAAAQERFAAAGKLAAALGTRKIIVVGRRSGLRTRGAETHLPYINLATDYAGLYASRALAPTQLFLLGEARRLLTEHAPHCMQVAITSPLELLRELFTIRGAGTLIKRGSIISRLGSYAELDRARLCGLLESSFGQRLDDGFFARPVSRIYLEETYRGAALVALAPLGAYLTKFAVEREAQGEGIGRDLWQLLVQDYPVLFWRARPQNAITSWYLQQCDGMARADAWNVFWKGLAPARIAEAIAYALAQPTDLSPEQAQ